MDVSGVEKMFPKVNNNNKKYKKKKNKKKRIWYKGKRIPVRLYTGKYRESRKTCGADSETVNI